MTIPICNICGLVMGDSVKHEEWHEKNDVEKIHKWFSMGFMFVNRDIKEIADKQKGITTC